MARTHTTKKRTKKKPRTRSGGGAGTESESGAWRAEDWYDHPLWYDIVHSPGTTAEVDGLERIEKRFCLPRPEGGRAGRKRVWLEPACGSGRYLRVAAARGRAVVGLDLNPRMIAFARAMMEQRRLKADLRVGDMTKVPVLGPEVAPAGGGGADFAFCLINSVRHLPTDAAMLAHLRSMFRAVRPGGVYCVGLGLTHYGAEFASEEVFSGSRSGTKVVQLAQFIPPEPGSRFEPIVNHLMVTKGKKEEHLDNTYRLRCYSGAQWAALLARTDWEMAGVVDEEGEDAVMLGGHMWKQPTVSAYGIFVLRRPLKKPS
jgi:SAM-dependent methyltransferase